MPTIEQARAWYPAADPVHGFDHILRVHRTALRIAAAEGADARIVGAAALLHDVGGAQDPAQPDAGKPGAPGLPDAPGGNPLTGDAPVGSVTANSEPARLSHHESATEFAGEVLRAEGWDEADIRAAQHCIRAHRFRDDSQQPQTLEAQVLFDADKLDAIGAIGVARAVAYAANAGLPAYIQPSESFLGGGPLQLGELHSAYHEYIFKLRKLKERMYTNTGRALAEARHRVMAEYFEQLQAETFGER